MNDYAKITKNTNEKSISADVSKEKQELFRRALCEGLSRKIDKTLKEYEDIEIPPSSKRTE